MGVVSIGIGITMVHRRVPPYTNDLGQNAFPAALVATGFVISAIAFLPSSRWLYRHITTKRKNEIEN